MSSLVFSKNNLFFAFLVIGYLFGVILYDFLEFKYTDELMVLFLLLFASLVVQERRKWKELIPLSIVVGIFAFYTIYSDLFRFLIYEQISPAYYPFGNRPHGSAGAIRLAAKPVFYGAGLL